MYRVPMIFPGQASQAVGMAKDLMDVAGPAADFLNTIDDVLGDNLTSTMFDGPAEVLTETRNAQPAILAHSTAITLALREKGIVPSLVAGHSLGEFSAAVAAGALAPADGLKIVRKRGDLMFAAGQQIPGTMAAVMGLNGEQVTEVCQQITAEVGVVVLANHNSEAQVAISGEIPAIDAAEVALKEAGARRVIRLNVSGAFHSPLLEGAGTDFRNFLTDIPVADIDIPLIPNVTAGISQTGQELREGFARQLTSPVLWHDTMNRIAGPSSEMPKVILEVGPGKVLTNLARRAFSEVKFVPVGTVADLDNVLSELAGL